MTTAQKTLSVNTSAIIMVWPAKAKRTFLSIQNQSTLNILIGVGAAPTSNDGLIIAPGAEWNPVNPPKSDIYATGIAAALVSQVFFTIEESL